MKSEGAARCPFDPGKILFLYTDGLTELADFRSPQAVADGIFTATEAFNADKFVDDVTIFTIGRE